MSTITSSTTTVPTVYSYPIAMRKAASSLIEGSLWMFSMDVVGVVADYMIDGIYGAEGFAKDCKGVTVPRVLLTQETALEVLRFLKGPCPIGVYRRIQDPTAPEPKLAGETWYPGVYVPGSVTYTDGSTAPFSLKVFRSVSALFRYFDDDVYNRHKDDASDGAYLVFMYKGPHLCRGERFWHNMQQALRQVNADTSAGIEIAPKLLDMSVVIFGINKLTGKHPLGDSIGAEGQYTRGYAVECADDQGRWNATVGGFAPDGAGVNELTRDCGRVGNVAVALKKFKLALGVDAPCQQ